MLLMQKISSTKSSIISFYSLRLINSFIKNGYTEQISKMVCEALDEKEFMIELFLESRMIFANLVKIEIQSKPIVQYIKNRVIYN